MIRVFTVALAALSLTATAAAQNSLRPGTLPDVEAKPIESANQRPAPAKKVSKTKSINSADEAKLLLHEAAELSQAGKSIEQFTEILELCKRASGMKLTPEESKYARDLQSWAHNKRGEAYAAQAAEFVAQGSDKEGAKLDRQALDDFQAAVKLDPNRWKAIHNRAVSFGVLGLHEDAVADFTRVTQLKPDYAHAWFNRAEIQLEGGHYSEAIRDYSEVIKLRPDDAVAFRQRGRAYSRANRTRQAIEDFDKAVGLNALDAVSLVERGEVHAQLTDYTSADADFREAIEADPDCAEAYRGAAWLMATCPQAKYRNSKFAVELGEQAMELAQAQKKHDFTFYDTLAAAYANAGRFEEAQQTLSKAIPRAPLADAAMMKKRLALYGKARPFREEAAATAKPASFKIQR